MNSVQLVVFDLMGTLIRDDGVVARAYDRALEQTGLQANTPEFDEGRAAIAALRGRPTLVVLTDVLGDPVIAEEATWAFDDAVLDEVPGFTPIEGANDVLADLAQQGILTAVTTSFSSDVRKAALRQLGWTDTFAVELAAFGTRRGHPAPDLLLHAILELRVDSVAQVAIVGDSPADLEAGNRAGAGLVIGVRSGTHSEEVLRAAPHTHIVDSVADVPAVLASPRTTGHRRAVDR